MKAIADFSISVNNQHIRVKRFKPVTLTVLAVIVGVGSGIAAYRYWSPTSDYNRLNEIEAQNKKRDETIAQLKVAIIRVQQDLATG